MLFKFPTFYFKSHSYQAYVCCWTTVQATCRSARSDSITATLGWNGIHFGYYKNISQLRLKDNDFQFYKLWINLIRALRKKSTHSWTNKLTRKPAYWLWWFIQFPVPVGSSGLHTIRLRYYHFCCCCSLARNSNTFNWCYTRVNASVVQMSLIKVNKIIRYPFNSKLTRKEDSNFPLKTISSDKWARDWPQFELKSAGDKTDE